MKKPSASFRWLFGFALMAVTVTGCKTTTTERPQMCTVIAVMGDVKYWDGQSNKAHIIKPGKQIPPGSTIQTAKGAGNWVDLAMGERLPDAYSSYPLYLGYPLPSKYPTSLYNPPRFDPADHMRIYENSILTLSKVTLRKVGENQVPDTRLQLLQGAVLFTMGATSPAQVPKRDIISPYHEIRGSNVVFRAERGIFLFFGSGLTRVIDGTMSVERTDQGITKELSPWQEYDPVTGVISPVGEELKREMINTIFVGDFAPTASPLPAFQVPQRPF
jgi:hypothetical protein